MKSSDEIILCSAIWYKDLPLKKNEIPKSLIYPVNVDCGIVFCGYRHPHCMYSMIALTGLRQCEAGKEVQGFLTNKNRFVDREEGARIHVANGGKLNYGKRLFSEDLY